MKDRLRGSLGVVIDNVECRGCKGMYRLIEPCVPVSHQLDAEVASLTSSLSFYATSPC